jgi:predicted dehydrogenase
MIRAAVIGAGWYAAENHIPALARRADVVLDGVCRLGAEPLERVRRAFGFAFASEDYRAVLARRPDVVVVASPHHLHHRHVRDALDAGADVLCEKPMTVDPAEAHDLVARAQRLGRHLLIANGHQYLPHLPEIRRRLAAGVIGKIEYITCIFVSATRPVFEGAVGFARWETSYFRPDVATWQDPANGGGFGYGQLSHSIALMLWLTGLTPQAVSARSYGTGAVDLADAATVAFEGGAVAAIGGAAAMPEGHRALLRLVLAGSGGMMSIDMDRDAAEIQTAAGVERLPVAPGDWVYNCVGPVDALVELAQGRGENRAPAAIGAATVSIIAGMLHSARAGGAAQPIAIPTLPGVGAP